MTDKEFAGRDHCFVTPNIISNIDICNMAMNMQYLVSGQNEALLLGRSIGFWPKGLID